MRYKYCPECGFVFLTERPVMMALSRIAIDVSDIGSTLFLVV